MLFRCVRLSARHIQPGSRRVAKAIHVMTTCVERPWPLVQPLMACCCWCQSYGMQGVCTFVAQQETVDETCRLWKLCFICASSDDCWGKTKSGGFRLTTANFKAQVCTFLWEQPSVLVSPTVLVGECDWAPLMVRGRLTEASCLGGQLQFCRASDALPI